MLITIPTYGRVNNQRTLHNLPPKIRQKTWLIVQEREELQYEASPDFGQLLILPSSIQTIAATRDWIIGHASRLQEDKILMLDDDLDFAIRREDDPTRFRVPNDEELELMFVFIEALLNDYAHVGVSGREGANRNDARLLYNTRMMRILGYQTKTLQQHGIKFNEGPGLMEDFRVTLDLLTRGYKNVLVNSFVHNQPSSQSSGGCSEYRTPEKQKEAAYYLASAFPDYVRVVEKRAKNWEKFRGMRYDVTVQWKRAYLSSGKSGSTEVLDGGAGENQEESSGTETVD